MKKAIVTTTINPPTEAIRKFDAMENWHLIVVGDEKTPKNYKLERGHYMSLEEQDEKYSELSRVLGRNSVDRRNIGFVEAYNWGADFIASVDDDNIPKSNWGDYLLTGHKCIVDCHFCADEVCDPLWEPSCLSSGLPRWHRGFPLQLVSKRPSLGYVQEQLTIVPLVQANLWDGDGDVDAIWRVITNHFVDEVSYETRWFTSNKMMPFNTQNTILSRTCFPDFVSIPFIGRMDDIWGAYWFQAMHPHSVVFGPATVYSVRNAHDVMRDMQLEYLGYEKTYELVKALQQDPTSIFKFIPEKSREAIKIYQTYFNKS